MQEQRNFTLSSSLLRFSYDSPYLSALQNQNGQEQSPDVSEGQFKGGATHTWWVQILYKQSVLLEQFAPTLVRFVWRWWHAIFVSPAAPIMSEL
jgi:hypothetical protein